MSRGLFWTNLLTMDEIIQFLLQHGYIILFIWVFAEQMGLPLPVSPLLFAAGALAGEGQLNFPIVVCLAFLASLLSNLIWYQIGLHSGTSVLSFLCRISFTPDSCVRRTTDMFSKHGAKSLLVAKFIPGLNVAAPPLAGIFHMNLLGFLIFNGLGTFFWVGSFAGLGYLFSDQSEQVAIYTLRVGSSILIIAIGGLAAYITWKFVQRRRFLRQLHIARITPEELKNKLDTGENLMILDVRPMLEFKLEPQTIPGALHLPLEQLDKDSPKISHDHEVILVCN